MKTGVNQNADKIIMSVSSWDKNLDVVDFIVINGLWIPSESFVDYWHNVFDSKGNIDYLQNNNIELVPVIFNKTKRSQHLDDIINLLHAYPEYDGIDLDY